MKTIIIAATAAAALSIPALAQAQSTELAGVYGNLGYAGTDNYAQTGAIQGRVGYRINNYVGVEGEAGWGIKGDKIGTGVVGTTANVKQRGEVAAYGVGFLPVTPNIDLLARVGYGTTKYKVSGGGLSFSDSNDSWNYGVGAQYTMDGQNGVRADFTRKDFTGNGNGKADVYSVAYVRKF